jgi:hypothetical protein
MPNLFVPLDVNYQESDGILAVTPLAELLYIRCLCLSKRRLSDGDVTYRQMQSLCSDLWERYPDEGDLTGELVAAGLLSDIDDGWHIEAWEKHNKTRAEVKSRGSKLNHERWHTNRGVVDKSCVWCCEPSESVAESVADSTRNPIAESVPTDSVADDVYADSVFLQGTGEVPYVSAPENPEPRSGVDFDAMHDAHPLLARKGAGEASA